MTPPPQTAAMLEIEELVVERGGQHVVDRASLRVARRELASLVGPSGCGKTTLLRAIAGLERARAGTVRIGGACVASADHWVPPEQRQVGMVFQEGALFPHLTVSENVRYGVRHRQGGTERALRALDWVGMTALAHRYPDQLSGGQQQRVALARALAPSPRIVLLDEPFASLDAGLRLQLREEVREILRTARTTALLVTHDQEEALSFADRVAVMQSGRVLQVDEPEQLYHRPASIEVAELIGGGQLLECSVRNGRIASPLGPLTTTAPDGAARLLVRAEDLDLLDGAATEGVSGVLGTRRFYGHDVLVDVRLSTGSVLRVRLAGSSDEPAGRRVRVVLRRGNFSLFPLAGGRVRTAMAGSDSELPRLSSA